MNLLYNKSILVLLLWVGCTFLANSQGLLNPQAIGKFLNGNLPASTPNGVQGLPIAPVLLSQTGAFSNLTDMTPSDGVIPYDMIEPFWSDGAQKFRWMAIPNDGNHNTSAEQIIFSNTEPWIFPAGAVLIKHFELGGKKLETRFEVKGDDGQYYYLTYKWNTNQTDAELLTASITEQVSVNGQTQNWQYLSADKCVDCHTSFAGNVLGPKTRQLNKAILYPNTQILANQLVTLSYLGIIPENITDANASNYMTLAAKDDTNYDLQYRARSYIDANCSSCHQPGSNNIGQFDARFNTPIENQNIINGAITYDEGIPNAEVIIPMDVDHSMMHFRMNSLATGVAMPPLAKDVVDEAGVQLIEDWINSLQPMVNNTPTALAEANISYGFVPMAVQFSGSNSINPNGNTLSYQWSFGDGTTANGENVNHTYNFAREYTVTLTVSNGIESDSNSIIITANNGNPGSNTVNFVDRTSLLNTANTSGVSIAIADMNGDGKDDIVRFNDATYLNIQYQNNSNQTFTEHNHGTVSGDRQWGICIADFDNNGYNDLMSGGAYDGLKIYSNNNGFNNYAQTPLTNGNIFLQGANFADIDNDGWVDVFACHDDAEARAYRNNSNGSFSYDADLISTETTPLSDNSGNYASIWTDYDNDGDLDLYISKCRGGVSSPSDPRRINMLWQNDGNNNYTEVAAQANLKIGAQTWLTDFGDIDNDGDMDALVINHYENSQLMRNNGNGTFTDISLGSGILPALNPSDYRGLQAFFRDFNNDGFVDIIATGNAHFLFYNNGDGTFTEAPNPFNSNNIHSAAVGDLNNDGFVDIYAGYAMEFNTPTNITDKLWINEGNTNNFIAINLKGTQSNINGIGARIEVHGSWGMQIREVRSGEGYGVMNSLTRYVGLGQANTISKVVVKWPSGIVDEVINPSPNQFLTIDEGSGICDDDDNDGVCNAADQCPGFNDLTDLDNNGIPDGCDIDCNCQTQNTTNRQYNIQSGSDDAEELQSGVMELSSGDLDMVYDDDDLNNAIKIGLRYQNINIPQGASIVSAQLKFQADEVSTTAATFSILIEANINPSTYSTANNNISQRSYYPTAINWNNVPTWSTVGEAAAPQTTVDISSLLNLVINDPNWNNGNALALKIEGSGYRTAESFEGNSTGPTLSIQYTTDCADLDNDGVTDICDACPNFDDNLIGTACNDNNACTTGEIYDSNCNCSGGILSDIDFDGVCDANDPSPNDPCIPNNCPVCEEITLTVTFDNYPEENSWAIFDNNSVNIASGGTYNNVPDGSTAAFVNCLLPGCYDLEFYDLRNDGICCRYGNGAFNLTNSYGEILGSGSEFNDVIVINFCLDNTQCDTAGEPCDDGDACTTGEIYNGTCDCVSGIIIDSDNDGICDSNDDCDNFDDNLIGTACDDGDLCTAGETYNTNCECSGGVFADDDNDGICNGYDICSNLNDNLIGTICDDGDVCTAGEKYDINCNCSGGTFTDADNDGICDAEEACKEHDIVNNNSIINSDIIVANFIENNGKIETLANVKFKAGNYVELSNDFEVDKYTNFEIMIEECNP